VRYYEIKCCAVYWELDILGRRLRGSAPDRTVYCVTLWFLYVGRPGEISQKIFLWLLSMSAMMLIWWISTLGITTAWIVYISHFWYCFGYCNVFILTMLTVGRWKLAATCCNNIRCWHDVVEKRRTVYNLQNAHQEHYNHHSDSRQQFSPLPDIVPKVPAVCLLKIVVLSCHAQRSVDR
jgi:hypothetical protein